MRTTTVDLHPVAAELASAVHLYCEFRTDIPLINSKSEADAVDMVLLLRTDVLEPLEWLVMAAGYDDWDEHNPFTTTVRKGWLQAVLALNEGIVLQDGDLDREEEFFDDEEDLSGLGDEQDDLDDELEDEEHYYPDDEFEESPFDLIDVERGQELLWKLLRVPEFAVYHATSPRALFQPDPNDWLNRGETYQHVANVQAELSHVFFLT